MRAVICWIGLSGYLAACWRALAAREGLDVKILYLPAAGATDAPFEASLTAGLPAEALTAAQAADPAYVAARVLEHRPDVVVIPGWVIKGYTALAFNRALAGVPFVMGIDTPLKTDLSGRLRQTLGRVRLRGLLRRMDRIFVSGERGFQYARFLGFPEAHIRRGVYGCDYDLFEPLYERRLRENGGAWPKRFLFTGRYVPVKGIDVLIAAYRKYRARHGTDAWPLTCCGKGPMAEALGGVDGIEDAGFVQPKDLPALWSRCGVFVLPSRYEPWGVVVAEAAAAGLPLVCTEACGASVDLVRSYYNGITIGTGDVDDLARGLSDMHGRYADLPAMGRRGQALAAGFSAEAFAERWHSTMAELVAQPT